MGGTQGDREQMAALDFEGPTAKQPETSISRALVEIRLRLAGYAPGQFQVLGAAGTSVVLADHVPATLDDAAVVAAIRQELAAQRGVAITDVEVRLVEPIRAAVLAEVQQYPQIEVQPLISPEAPLGRQRVRIGLHAEGRLIATTDVAVQALMFQEVQVAAEAISADAPVDEDQVKLVRRAMSDQEIGRLPGPVVGRRLRRGVPAGTVIQASDVAPVRTTPDIKRGDIVTLFVTVGRLMVTTSDGKAVDSGQVGERIRVKNTTSGKTVTGIVQKGKIVKVTL